MPKLRKYINKIDVVNDKENKHITKQQRKKVERRCYKKITNIVDDLHWKTINYLTKNFGNIIIGNMSTKSIIKNSPKNNLTSYVKRVASLMKLFTFKQRLEYKCTRRKIGYMEVDEAYTSKTCTKCGEIKNNLGGSKVYKCDNCNLILDRDINGARNIYLKYIGSK